MLVVFFLIKRLKINFTIIISIKDKMRKNIYCASINDGKNNLLANINKK